MAETSSLLNCRTGNRTTSSNLVASAVRVAKTYDGAIAQLVEQRTENPCVPGSIPGGTTKRKRGVTTLVRVIPLFFCVLGLALCRSVLLYFVRMLFSYVRGSLQAELRRVHCLGFCIKILLSFLRRQNDKLSLKVRRWECYLNPDCLKIVLTF